MRALLAAGVLGGALLAVPASAADPTATVAVSPEHGLPGSTVHVTVTVAGCTATAVGVSLSGRSVDESSANLTGGTEASATRTSPGVWEADLAVHDLAAPQDATAEAAVTCAGGSPNGVRGSHSFHVDGFTTQRVVVSPDPVRVGQRLSFVMTGGHGSCQSAYFKDAVGTTWTLWFYDNVYGPTITTRKDARQAPSRISGSFRVPADAHPGRSTVDIRCTQDVDHPARFTVLGAASPSPHASTGGAAPTPSPTLSPTAIATPTTAASSTPTAAPSPAPTVKAVVTHPTAYGRSLGIGALLGLLAVAGVALVRRRGAGRA